MRTCRLSRHVRPWSRPTPAPEARRRCAGSWCGACPRRSSWRWAWGSSPSSSPVSCRATRPPRGPARGPRASSWRSSASSSASTGRLPEQVVRYLVDLVRGDWGTSIHTRQPVLSDVMTRLVASLELVVAAILIAIVVGIPLGVVAARWKGRAARLVQRLLLGHPRLPADLLVRAPPPARLRHAARLAAGGRSLRPRLPGRRGLLVDHGPRQRRCRPDPQRPAVPLLALAPPAAGARRGRLSHRPHRPPHARRAARDAGRGARAHGPRHRLPGAHHHLALRAAAVDGTGHGGPGSRLRLLAGQHVPGREPLRLAGPRAPTWPTPSPPSTRRPSPAPRSSWRWPTWPPTSSWTCCGPSSTHGSDEQRGSHR